ncbi:hypothetical protein SAMN05660413_01310 [Salegentibacter flavus]|uniref:Uncharacterized protein n=1 Tax=Salegentibacter flavus TaxID=287099 RepID=A0A1I4ZGH4_9FLAO|nr:hypothetical protein SAMN05660413_01310 [Salegentibacter flavus]
MKKVSPGVFKVTNKINLDEIPTKFDLEVKKKRVKKSLESTREDLGEWQDKLYAHGKYAVLVCL